MGLHKDPYRHSVCLHPDLQCEGFYSANLVSDFKEPSSSYRCETNRTIADVAALKESIGRPSSYE